MLSLTASDVANIIDRSPISGLQVRIILICLLVSALDGFDTQCIGFVAPALVPDLGIARASLGTVFGAGLVGTMLGSLFLGPLGDRFGRKPITIIATLLFALFAILTAAATNLWSLIALRFATGVGLGMVLPNVIALAVEYSPQRRRTLLVTIVVLGISVGGIVGGVLSTQLIPRFGWRSVFLAGGLLPLLTVPLILRFVPESTRFMSTREQDFAEIARILGVISGSGDYSGARFITQRASGPPVARATVGSLFTKDRGPVTAMLWLVFIANLFMMNLMILWLPSVLKAAGLPITQAILATSMFNVGGIIGGVALAQSVDRWSASKILPFSFLLTAVAIGCVGLLSQHPVALFIAIFLSGAGVIGNFSGVNVLSGTVYPTAIRTTGVGWAFGVGRVGSVLGPIAGGIVFALGWTVSQIFLFAALPAVLAAGAVFYLGRAVSKAETAPVFA